MTILNLVIRPVTSVVLCRIASERGGGDFAGRGTFGDIFGKKEKPCQFCSFNAFKTLPWVKYHIYFLLKTGRGDTVAPGRPRAAYDDIDNPSGHQSVPGVVTIDGASGKQPPPYHG